MMLDGGLATALENKGFDLDDDLWSAQVLIDQPDAIRQVHLDFLTAGADCITASTYQATIPGFMGRGFSREQAIELLEQSVGLALEARDQFWADKANRAGRRRPLVAASVGPFGAYLADGSEYTGKYPVTERELEAFHKERLEVLSGSGADLLACETIPSTVEATVLLKLLGATPGPAAWLAFSCSGMQRISDGTAIAEVAQLCDSEDRVVAIGVNCTPPEFVGPLIREVRAVTKKTIVVYPNSGERYDAKTKKWEPSGSATDIPNISADWVRIGAECVGGCCRVSVEEVARIRSSLIG